MKLPASIFLLQLALAILLLMAILMPERSSLGQIIVLGYSFVTRIFLNLMLAGISMLIGNTELKKGFLISLLIPVLALSALACIILFQA